ncbi:hypothetical protein [Photorhabdus antumapuensis]|uniref:hypothetical protein n=1 Tax=Photorhabdus antumapuensis TaxID=2862867 RepID=UPI001CED17A0|nr:hypothetical protein [Photorhabdus antumapuensis]
MDNNHLSVEQNHSRSEELVNCHGDTSCRSAVRDKYRQEYDRVQERITTCSGADQCVAVAKELRALQSDYSARMREIQEKARMQGLDSFTPTRSAGMGKQPYQPNQGAIGNMNEFLTQPGFGAQIKNSTQKTSQIYQGRSVYKTNNNIGKVINHILIVNIKTILRFLITKGNLRPP